MTDLDKIDALAAAATPGPWTVVGPGEYGDRWIVVRDTNRFIVSMDDAPNSAEDAAFIAACDPATIRDLIAAARSGEADAEDAAKWRAAEAEGHVVDFTETGFGLQHPPSCRPDLIGCDYNEYLAARYEPDEEPGRYRMALVTTGHGVVAEYAALHSKDGAAGLRALAEWPCQKYNPPHDCGKVTGDAPLPCGPCTARAALHSKDGASDARP